VVSNQPEPVTYNNYFNAVIVEVYLHRSWLVENHATALTGGGADLQKILECTGRGGT